MKTYKFTTRFGEFLPGVPTSKFETTVLIVVDISFVYEFRISFFAPRSIWFVFGKQKPPIVQESCPHSRSFDISAIAPQR